MKNDPLETLRHHVTGAIERGEAVAIVERPAGINAELVEALAGLLRHAPQPGNIRKEFSYHNHRAYAVKILEKARKELPTE